MMGYGGMMGYGFDGMGYGLGFLWQMVWLVLIIAVIYFVVNSLSSSRGQAQTSTGSRALRILDERFARGEIDAEEYRRMREELLR
ncbi:Short C-terminal domain [Geoglobus ahangari]|uniref:Short C-terminal domain n=1 Tax=Geoglobus ahangari TaxID=113653 RepID=A0A0F7IGJ0_9EURY|nr:SHOCT domain-containing protein [Geoglobus ahangari]AKG91967.1 Short C-terminal domain [Geoglobus ahangari]